MKRDTTKPAGDAADVKLFDYCLELIETDRRTKVRGFIETTIAETFDRFGSDPARLVRIAAALDPGPFAWLEILVMGKEMLERTPRLAIQSFAWSLPAATEKP